MFYLALCLFSYALALPMDLLSELPSKELATPFSIPRPARGGNPHSVTPPLLPSRWTVVLDPGHGGRDAGTQSIAKPRQQEKTLTLTTARLVQGYLQRSGYQVWMTREDDRFVALEQRAKWANEKHPRLFVSIHYNAAPSSEAQGIEVYFYTSKEKNERTAHSKRLAQMILRHAIAQTGAKSRGVKSGNYAVIRETTMPAVLVEGGFVTNEMELSKLKDPLYLQRLASGVARGIQEYLNSTR